MESFFDDVWVVVRNMRFLWSFLALTALYLFVGTLLALLKGMAGGSSRSSTNKVESAWKLVAGTKAARAFTLLAMTLATFVIAIFNPGEGLLIDSSDWYPVKKEALRFLYGTNAPVTLPPPPAPNPWGWFWWKCLGVYVLITGVYFAVALTQEVTSSAREAWLRYEERRKTEQQPSDILTRGNLLILLVGVFMGLLASKLWGWTFGGRFRK